MEIMENRNRLGKKGHEENFNDIFNELSDSEGGFS